MSSILPFLSIYFFSLLPGNDKSIATTKFEPYHRFPPYIWAYFVYRSISHVDSEDICAGMCLLLDSSLKSKDRGSCHFYHFTNNNCYIGDFNKPQNHVIHNQGTQTINMRRKGFGKLVRKSI